MPPEPRRPLRATALMSALALTAACADATDTGRRATASPDAAAPAIDATVSAPPAEDAFVPRDAFTVDDDDAAVAQPPDATAAFDAATPGTDGGDAAALPADGFVGTDGPAPDAAPVPDAAPPAPDACAASPEVCNGLDDDCDGQVDEGLPLQWLDLDGDGYGSPSGIPTCQVADDRVPNDGDCDDDDPDVNPNAPDMPELTFADTNCDDVDGDRRALLFVDAAAPLDAPVPADGTPERPFPTIGAALEAALADARITGLAVAGGVYEGPVALVEGISLYGGYDAERSWARGLRPATVVRATQPDRGRIVALRASGIRAPTTVEALTFEAEGDPGPGGSLYAIHAHQASALVLRAVTARAGDAPGGIDGVDGVDGQNGLPGLNGGDCGRGPGQGGASTCGADGGAGGAGATRGNDGAPGGIPGCGGAGGPRGNGGAGGDGGHGCSPGSPPPGLDGVGGEGGTLDEQWSWVTVNGGHGVDGAFGPPGGGGGGGGGAAVIDGTAGSGAGGGAGGCGGQAGTGGTGGGGSFALFAVDSTGLVVERGTFTTGAGGAGGRGGTGGRPGRGADGGTGGRGREAFACGGLAGPGWGGDGGRGADGARGGNGGGGAGGPAVAIYCVDTRVGVDEQTFLQPGIGGPGGDAPTSRGVGGLSLARFGCD